MSPPLVQKQPPPLKWANQCASLCHCVSSLAHLCCLCHGAKSGQHNMEYSPHRCLLSQQGRDWNRQSSMHPPTCTAGLDPQSPVDAHEKSISGKNQKGCDLRQTRDKVRKCSRREESRFAWTIFVWFVFDFIFQNIFEITPEQTYSRQNRIHLAEYSCAKVSDPSEVPWFVREFIF